jgi:hypothetical protein
MGIVPLSLQILLRHADLIGGLRPCRMMELGCQQMLSHPDIAEGSAAKEWFERQGIAQHVSIDINGKFDSLPLDLTKPIYRPEWEGNFDIVTDFGTSEHVGADLSWLWQARENCHRWARPYGLLIYMNPKTGHWPDHGYHYFTESHYRALAPACRYRVVDISEHPTLGNAKDGAQILAVLQKNGGPFVPLADFIRLCQGTVFPR